MKFISLTLISCFLTLLSYSQQCSVQVIPADTITITCGETLQLDMAAYGNSGNQVEVFSNDFNDGTAGTGWQATPAATFTNPCSPPSPDSTIHIWLGDATPQPRTLTTQSFDLSLGGAICFEMRFAIQNQAAPCEGPDEPQEGVYLQYSIDGGSVWNNINYFDPIGGFDPTLTSWQQYCFPLPIAAQTSNTQIRWFQDATSGAQYDHWGLDNVSIFLNDASYGYQWSNGATGQAPPTVTVTTDSVFTVYYSNGSDDTCTASVVVQTVPPMFTVTSVNDTSLCGSGCIDLNASANILVRPASQPNYANNESQSIEPGIPAFPPLIPSPIPGITIINVNVGGLDINTITFGSIVSVCLDLIAIDISSFDIKLKCPSGTEITLIPPGALSGTSLSNTCFTTNATSSILSGSSPYSGNYFPYSGSLNDLVGCSANGLWTMTITTYSPLGGFSNFNSWGITFDLPEISYQGVYEWQPTTGLSDPLSLNPTACPENTTTYTLAVRDSNNCATYTHDVTIATTPFEIDSALTVKPLPGEDNGEITVTTIGGLEPFTYSIDNGLTTQDSAHFTNLAPGTYIVSVTDAGTCFDTITVVLDEFEPIQIPNIINPNSQEADNKVFMLKGMTEPEVVIYNRWGKKIYQSDAYKNDWDGEKYHEGTYFYHAKDKADGKDYSGFFQLVRF